MNGNVHIPNQKRGRHRWESAELISHTEIHVGPFVYADRELWGLRTRTIWLFGKKFRSWRVR